MSRRMVSMMLALMLALSAFAGTLVTGPADEHGNNETDGTTELYLPWVPNGSEIDDVREGIDAVGPFSGAIVVQNLEDEGIQVQYDVLATGESGTVDIDDGLETITLTVDDLFNDNPVDGSGVVLSTTEGEQIAAVQKQSSPEGPDDEARTSDEHEIVAGYTALTNSDIGSDVVLPIVQTNNFWNTVIRLTNFGVEPTDVEITMHEAPGDNNSEPITVGPETVPAGETLTVDLLGDEIVDAEWVGSARISSQGQPVGAAAERVKNQTDMLIMNTSKSLEDGAMQYAPLVFQEWNHWNTGISIANLADVDNEILITYYDRDGNELNTDSLTVPANGMDYVYTPASLMANDGTELDAFVGSAVITGQHPFRGSVDEVKYFGEDPDTGHAMSYMVEDQAATAGETLALPIFQSGDEQGGGDTSGIQLFNPTDEWVAGAVRFITHFGHEYQKPLIVHLEPGEGYTVYPHEIAEFVMDMHGSALVQVYAGDGAITAVSNNVNYDVTHDGSASFNLMLTGEVGPETPDYILRADPRRETNEWWELFTLTATLMNLDGDPIVGDNVLIMTQPSIGPPPFGEAEIITTDDAGQAIFDGDFTRAGEEFIDRFTVFYPAFDPGEEWPEDRIEAHAWKTWVAPGPEPDASIEVELSDDAGNPLAPGDTVTTGDQVTATATVIQDGAPLVDQEVTFNWGYSEEAGHHGHLESGQSLTNTEGQAQHILVVGDSPNISVQVQTIIDGWPLEDSLDGFLEVSP